MNRLLAFVVALWFGIDTCPAPVNFDGTDDKIEIGSGTTLELSLPVTIAVWVNPDVIENSIIFATDQWDSSVAGGYSGYSLMIANSHIYASFGDSGGVGSTGRRTKEGSTTLTSGSWMHLACVISGSSSIEIYLNGENDSGTYSGSASAVTHTASHGPTISDPGVEEFNGQIQDVRIYNRALSAAEIETLYKSRIGEGNPVSSGLVGYWPLNDNSGNLASATFVDRTGNGNNGTGSDADGSGGQCTTETFLTSP